MHKTLRSYFKICFALVFLDKNCKLSVVLLRVLHKFIAADLNFGSQ